MTEDEARRTEIFEAEVASFNGKGYISKDITTSALTANVVGTVLGVVAALPLLLLYLWLYGFNESYWNFWVFIIAIAVSIVVHELIHGLTWSLFTRNGFKSVAFGFIWKYLTPYCSCKEALKRGQYILGGIMPGLVLGIIPQAVACFTGIYMLAFFGAFMTVCAGGDLMIFVMILMDRKNRDEHYLDHPTKIGLVKFYKEA